MGYAVGYRRSLRNRAPFRFRGYPLDLVGHGKLFAGPGQAFGPSPAGVSGEGVFDHGADHRRRCRARFPTLWLATGHDILGWTMAAGTGKLLADWIGSQSTAIDT